LARDCPENFKDTIDLLNNQLRSRKTTCHQIPS
jgi:hypothetical protein